MHREHAGTYLLTSLLFLEFEERNSLPDTSFVFVSWFNSLESYSNRVIETVL
jgi:hypothetical protein